MGTNYYTNHPAKTLTLDELIEKLTLIRDNIPDTWNLPVIYKTPFHGAFGGDMPFTIDFVTIEEIPEQEINHGKQSHYDEETGEEWEDTEDYIEKIEHWKGIVLE